MIGRTEIHHSLELIDRARRRLDYQRSAVRKLHFDRDSRSADVARGMEQIMSQKLALLLKQHTEMLQNNSSRS